MLSEKQRNEIKTANTNELRAMGNIAIMSQKMINCQCELDKWINILDCVVQELRSRKIRFSKRKGLIHIL